MISEIENIQKGIVVATVEDNANKRIIGIGTSTVTPDPVTGIAPLSKQTAFSKEQTESIQAAAEKVLGVDSNIPAVPAIEPTLASSVTQEINQSPSLSTPVEPIQTSISPLPEPKVNDMITEEPMKVDIPAELSSIPTSAPLIEPIKEAIAPITEPIATMVNQNIQEQVPTFEPVSEPEPTSEVLATEPTSINEGMFANANIPTSQPNNVAQEIEQTIQPLPFEAQAPLVNEKNEEKMPEKEELHAQESSLNQEQMEQIAKKISDLVYREVMTLLGEITKSQTQNIEEKMDSSVNLVNPVLEQAQPSYEETPIAMTL